MIVSLSFLCRGDRFLTSLSRREGKFVGIDKATGEAEVEIDGERVFLHPRVKVIPFTPRFAMAVSGREVAQPRNRSNAPTRVA